MQHQRGNPGIAAPHLLDQRLQGTVVTCLRWSGCDHPGNGHVSPPSEPQCQQRTCPVPHHHEGSCETARGARHPTAKIDRPFSSDSKSPRLEATGGNARRQPVIPAEIRMPILKRDDSPLWLRQRRTFPP